MLSRRAHLRTPFIKTAIRGPRWKGISAGKGNVETTNNIPRRAYVVPRFWGALRGLFWRKATPPTQIKHSQKTKKNRCKEKRKRQLRSGGVRVGWQGGLPHTLHTLVRDGPLEKWWGGGVGKKPKKNSCKGKCQEKKFVQRRRERKKIHAEGRSNCDFYSIYKICQQTC